MQRTFKENAKNRRKITTFHRRYSEEASLYEDAAGTSYKITPEQGSNSVLYEIEVREGDRWIFVASFAALNEEHALKRASNLYYRSLGDGIKIEHRYDEREFVPQYKNYGRRK